MVGNSRARTVRRSVILALSTVVVIVVAGGLYWFQPWKLWTDQVVDEPLPRIAAVASTPAPAPSAVPSNTVPPDVTRRTASPKTTTPVVPPPVSRSAPTTAASAQAVLLADGELISHEHQTTGSVELIRLANGHRVLTLENLRTSNGPALHVWLTDAPVLPGSAGWDVFDDGLHLDLGELKGNIGNQMYPVGDDVDLGRYSSVTIWCERFSVSFGAAALSAA